MLRISLAACLSIVSLVLVGSSSARADDSSPKVAPALVEGELGAGTLFSKYTSAGIAANLGVHLGVSGRWTFGASAMIGAPFGESETAMCVVDAPYCGQQQRLQTLFLADVDVRYHVLLITPLDAWLGAALGLGVASFRQGDKQTGPHVGAEAGLALFPASFASLGLKGRGGALVVSVPNTTTTALPEVFFGASLLVRAPRTP